METRHYKIAVFGAPRVGKSAFVNQLCFEKFTEDYKLVSEPVSGVFNKSNVKTEITEVSGYVDILHIDKVPFSQYQDVSAALLIFSVTDKKSFEDLSKVLEKMREHIKKPIILIANQIDLREKQAVRFDAIKQFVLDKNITLIETSSKSRSDILQAIKITIEEIELYTLLDDVRAQLAIVGPSRLIMKDALIKKCESAKSIHEGIQALITCGKEAQKDHDDRSGSRFLWYGPLFHPTSATKMKTDALVEKYEAVARRIGGL